MREAKITCLIEKKIVFEDLSDSKKMQVFIAIGNRKNPKLSAACGFNLQVLPIMEISQTIWDFLHLLTAISPGSRVFFA